MKKFVNQILILAILSLAFFSCTSNRLISNGAYSDISLNQNPDQFEIKRLKEIKSEGKTFFGIPVDTNLKNKTGMVVRFNGINLFGANRVAPTLTLVALSIAGGGLIQEAIGYNDEYRYRLPLAATSVMALPITGAINNQIWGTYISDGRAAQKLNRKLIESNQDVDVFLNPKYTINREIGFWKSSSIISVKPMGAILKIE